jgi:TonB family protein
MRYLWHVLLLLFLMQAGSSPPEPCVVHVESLEYPSLARQAQITGEVRASAWIDGQGSVTLPEVSTGHPLLRETVLNNIRKWKFRPLPSGSFRLDVTYTFVLEGNPLEGFSASKVVFDLPNQVRVTTRPPRSDHSSPAPPVQ